MAINESLDGISKSLRNILGNLDTANTKVKNLQSSSQSLQKQFGQVDTAVKNLIKSLEKAVEVQGRLETGASRLASSYAKAGVPTVTATMSGQSGVPSQGGSNLMSTSLSPVSAPAIGAGAGVPLAAVTGIRAPSMGGLPAMGATKPLAGAPTFGGIPAEMALLGLAGMNGQPGSVGGGGAGGSKALGLAKIGGRLGLTAAAAGLQFAYNATPGYRDAMAFQEALFTTAFAGATFSNPYNEGAIKRQVRASFGTNMSSSTDALGAAALLTSRGLGPNNRAFGSVMAEAASQFALTGMSNPAAASGLANLQGGTTSGRLAQYGIFTNSFQDGSYKGLGNVIDQLWARWFGSPSAKVPMEVFEAQLLGGYIGSDLRTLFGDSPELYETIVSSLRLKAQAGGRSGIDFASRRGPNSYATIGRRLGMTEENLPRLTQGAVNESRYGAISATEDALNSGMRISAGLIQTFNQKVEDSAEVLDLFYQGKGAVSSFLDSTEGLAAASAAATVAIASLQALADGINLLTGSGGAPPIVANGGGRNPKGGKPGGRPGGLAGSLAAGIGALAATLLLQPGVDKFGKDPDEAGFLGGGLAGSAKDFMNILARTGTGALTGLAVAGLPGAVVGSILEGGFGIYQGITNPNFNVKGANAESTLVQEALGWVTGLFSAKGTMGAVRGSGSSTSDNIHALLSPGEFVVNARAVQAVGVDALNNLNSMGQTFGSAFASPAKNFDKGGSAGGNSSKGIGQVLELAKKFSHLPYSSSASVPLDSNGNPTAWGCATSVAWLYKEGAGVSLPSPSLSWAQWQGLSQTVSEQNMQPGDLIFQKNSGPSRANDNPINHVEMYLGPGQIFNGGVGIQRSPSYPPVANGIKRVIGGSSAAWEGYGIDGAKNTKARSITKSQSPVIAEGGSDYVRAMAAAAGGQGNFMKGVSISPFGSSGPGLKAAFTMSDSVGSALGGGSLIGILGGISSSSQSNKKKNGKGEGVGDGKSDPVADTGSSPTGSGPQWLYDYLVSKGMRGGDLRILWTIGMRESGGTPDLVAAMSAGRFNHPKVPKNIDFNPDVEYGFNGGRYDVGVFQINSQHIAKVKSMFGGNMLRMLNPDNNFAMMKSLSSGFTRWTPWGIAGVNGNSLSYIDWSTWDKPGSNKWASEYGPTTEQRDRQFLKQFEQYNKKGYSKGAWRTSNEVANLHEGEMVLPAQAAEDFRGMLREALSGRGGSSQPVTINVHIAQASEAEAMRFAQKVKRILDDDKTLDSLRSR